MAQRYGIDTSILVRLLTGDPAPLFERCTTRLTELVQKEDAEIFASNQVIGEAYVAVQHHYGVSKADARDGLRQVLNSGLVRPLRGREVFAAIDSKGGCGLLDRLIALDYKDARLETLTVDRKMARLEQATLLH